jgi:hypothetical protein
LSGLALRGALIKGRVVGGANGAHLAVLGNGIEVGQRGGAFCTGQRCLVPVGAVDGTGGAGAGRGGSGFTELGDGVVDLVWLTEAAFAFAG